MPVANTQLRHVDTRRNCVSHIVGYSVCVRLASSPHRKPGGRPFFHENGTQKKKRAAAPADNSDLLNELDDVAGSLASKAVTIAAHHNAHGHRLHDGVLY